MCQRWRSHQRGDIEDALYTADREVVGHNLHGELSQFRAPLFVNGAVLQPHPEKREVSQFLLGSQFAVRDDTGDLHWSDGGFVLGLDC
jgi:hypothetical protein